MKKLFGITGEEDWKTLRNSVIPGGAHTYSKGDDQFPENAPAVFERGKGAWAFTPDGQKFLDMAMGLRSVTLGHCYEPVTKAVAESLTYGANLSRPSVFEAKYAENLLKALKWPDMVKLCKNGSTATSAAVKLARAYTDRKLIARCRQHPFFSYDDWFIGSTNCPRGVPREVSNLTVQFDYENLESVDEMIAKHPKDIACIILEPLTDRLPKREFLLGLRDRCDKHGIVFILDEMITGFRLALGGGSEHFGIVPDLATFGKGIANGFSMSALVGKRKFMELGDITPGRPKVFLVSTTHGAEIGGLFAAQATLNIYQTEPVIQTIAKFGRELRTQFNALSEKAGLIDRVAIGGIDAGPTLMVTTDGKPDLTLRTLVVQEFIKEGVLIPYLAPSYSHGDEELEFLCEAFQRIALTIKGAINTNSVASHVKGPVIKPVFREIN